MIKDEESGSIVLIIALGLSIVLFLAAAGFGLWAFNSRQEYKNETDKIVANAVALAVKQEDSKKEAEFVQREKKPYKTYVGPETYGRVSITYPKTWSATIDESANGNVVLDGYFHPNFVPAAARDVNFALRVQISQTSYAAILQQFDGAAKSGQIKVSPYAAPKEPTISGVRITGQIDPQKSGVLILLPLRDKTIKIWTESNQFLGDLTKIVLANLTFVP